MDILSALILGIIEGITEFLPISSTAHILLAQKLMHLPNGGFEKTFAIGIQLGAILAVFSAYRKELFQNTNLVKKILVAFLPSALVGFALYKVIKELFFESTHLILISLFLGGIALILLEEWHKKRILNKNLDSMSFKDAFWIGIAQAISVIPGVSRAGATIMGGLILNFERVAIVKFSFLLAVPTMIAATFYDLYKSGFYITGNEIGILLIGGITAFLSAYLSVRYFLKFVQSNTFIAFGVYRILIALALWQVIS